MKLFNLVLAAAFAGSFAGADAMAQQRGDRSPDRGVRYDRDRYDDGYRYDDRYDRDRRDRYDRERRRNRYGRRDEVEVNCSPEVKQKNVGILENTVNGLIVTPQFKDATVLRDTVVSIQSQGDIESRIAAYTDLVGVDSSNPSEVAEFVGARDLSPYVDVASKKLQLSNEQAETLVNTLNENLLNGIND